MLGDFKEPPTFLMHNKEPGRWLEPNEGIVRFTPSRGNSKYLNVTLPYDPWGEYKGPHNTTSIHRDKLSASDFQLVRTSDQAIIGVESIKENNILYYSDVITLQISESLEANKQYELRMSPTSSKNELRLPEWAGDYYSVEISTLSLHNNWYMSMEDMADRYHAHRSIALKNPTPPPPAPDVPRIGGGGGGFLSNPVSDTADGVKLDKSTLSSKLENGADGKSYSRVSITADQMSKAVEALQKKDAKGRTLTLEAAGAEAGAKIDIPASAIKDAIATSAETVLAIQSDAGTYRLPVRVLKNVTEKLGTELKDAKVTISVTKAAESTNDALKSANPGVKPLLANPIEFSIVAETSSGKKTEIHDFDGTYVERTITVPSSLDAAAVSVVTFDPATGQMSFIPAIIRNAEGMAEVTIKSARNSLYTVVEAAKAFDDLKTHWAKSDVEQLASKHIVNGMSESTFAPDQQVTRAQFAAMLVTALGLKADAAAASFADVQATDWYAGSVGTAAKLGLVQGLSAEQFAPNASITREQMAVMIARAMKLAGKQPQLTAAAEVQQLSSFADQETINSWAKTAVAQAVEAKIVNGLSEQGFAPNESATRAQAVVMLKRFLQYVQFMN
ncbi:S-layer homology domain-containing protein [Paenibacillus sp. YYML68]|uniref:S-layer homology domain-containing protein n=1 Tax=Paenibacillus sp. YYML68 TaxID=2909250 RepID=UPI00249290CB|nr:S-layer homology domain-containing protein [Paenibacillus sp. YYML68]